jgi:hypothetical protein
MSSGDGAVVTMEDVLALARLRDPLGVLSVYVSVDPAEAVGAAGSAAVETRNALRDLEARTREEGVRERWVALGTRLEELEGTLERLSDSREGGRGRALFVSLSDGEARTYTLDVPLLNRVVLEEAAYVRPLVAALDRGRPTGLVTVSRHGIHACESRLGAARELYAREFDVDTGEWPDYRGPADPNPQLGRSSASQRDTFQRRIDAQLARLLAQTGEELRGLASTRGWDVVTIAGDARLAGDLGAALDSEREVVVVGRVLDGLSPLELCDALAPDLEQARERRELRLVEAATSAASGGGAGAIGLQDTLEALVEGRVAHLLFDDRRDYEGLRAADGRLLPPGVRPPGVTETELIPEPSLAERMVERALETGARVSPLTGAPADALAPLGGVAAVLRW